ncbi:GPI anchored protein [Aspergillus bombycis]|uniref:GPI anchored protein n=1 Tax=Aspergillus bombycis TaxID=109264 RepID=A0A1F8A4X2_9EURO|nr:GPI anchored protein [Aspergillus bombycis]OGM46459.1 GPI anchored protein [Aspergillus bombycis]
MRTVQLLALSGLMLMSNVAMGAELDRDDVPNRCWEVCGPVVGIAHKCDNMHDNDRAEMKCICDWNQAPSLIPLCEACIAQYRSERNNRDDDDDDDDDDDRNPHHNDAYDILTSCSLSTTSYNPTAAASAASSASTNATDTTPTATSSGIASSTNSGSSGNSNSNAVSNTNSATSAQNTDNAASAYSTPKAASLAAVVGLGFLAWL